MVTEDLINYIRNQREAGASDVAIFDELERAGWQRVDIDEAAVLIEAPAKESRLSQILSRNREEVAHTEPDFVNPDKPLLKEEEEKTWVAILKGFMNVVIAILLAIALGLVIAYFQGYRSIDSLTNAFAENLPAFFK